MTTDVNDTNQLRKYGKITIDYVADYLDNIHKRRVTPDVKPGWLKYEIPSEAPQEPESVDVILKDVEDKIMPGMTHWHHPRFHAYFPSGISFGSIYADIICDAVGAMGFSWVSGPAITELEMIVMDWYGKALGLPDEFIANPSSSNNEIQDSSNSTKNTAGGVIQGTQSEVILTTMLSARTWAIKRLKDQNPYVDEAVLLSKLVAYTSKEAHSCHQKDAMLTFVKLRIIEPDEDNCLGGDILRQVMLEDQANGLVPFYVSASLGTTGTVAYDYIEEIGNVCKEFPCVWFHVDGAYAGASFVCPELRGPLKGLELADSFGTNPNKWFKTCYDCSCLWVKDKYKLTKPLMVNPPYLESDVDELLDMRHWQIPLSRKMRSLKLWFTLRTHGISGMQKYIRNHVTLAKYFERLVRSDPRFEVTHKVTSGLVCFRLVGTPEMDEAAVNALNHTLEENINGSGRLFLIHHLSKNVYILRFVVCYYNATESDMDQSWEVIKEMAEKSLKESLIHGEEISDELKKKLGLTSKTSYFAMVASDPKYYNPAIAYPVQQAPRNALLGRSGLIKEKKPTQPPVTRLSWPIGAFCKNEPSKPDNQYY